MERGVPPNLSEAVMHAASARWLGYEKWIVAGEVAIVLVSAEDSDGGFSLIELIDAPHSRDDSPLHAHPTHTQTYCTMQGIGALHIHGEDVLLHPGERYTIPPGTPHQAWNPGNTISIVHMAMSPGGVENVYRRIGHRFEPCSFATGLAIKREQDIDEVMSIAREMGLLETPG
jgi:mannose-6-phosphate isomerase-like protein (cupin superfamily)